MKSSEFLIILIICYLVNLAVISDSRAETSAESERVVVKVVAQPISPLELRKSDHICLVGNALGERMQHQNWWETGLHASFPDLELTVRNESNAVFRIEAADINRFF